LSFGTIVTIVFLRREQSVERSFQEHTAKIEVVLDRVVDCRPPTIFPIFDLFAKRCDFVLVTPFALIDQFENAAGEMSLSHVRF
jgi:hypothetical protein